MTVPAPLAVLPLAFRAAQSRSVALTLVLWTLWILLFITLHSMVVVWFWPGG